MTIQQTYMKFMELCMNASVLFFKSWHQIVAKTDIARLPADDGNNKAI